VRSHQGETIFKQLNSQSKRIIIKDLSGDIKIGRAIEG
jgi:hypothetical protein